MFDDDCSEVFEGDLNETALVGARVVGGLAETLLDTEGVEVDAGQFADLIAGDGQPDVVGGDEGANIGFGVGCGPSILRVQLESEGRREPLTLGIDDQAKRDVGPSGGVVGKGGVIDKGGAPGQVVDPYDILASSFGFYRRGCRQGESEEDRPVLILAAVVDFVAGESGEGLVVGWLDLELAGGGPEVVLVRGCEEVDWTGVEVEGPGAEDVEMVRCKSRGFTSGVKEVTDRI